jgi:RNA polymerase sigma-70 factor, ECF subfamily
VNSQFGAGEIESDWSLLARIGRKDEEALSALYDRYSGLVFSEAARIFHNIGAAEEVLQDLFFQIWRTAERFDPTKGSLAGWLLVSARNRAISTLRRKNGKGEELDENGVRLDVDLESHAAQNLFSQKLRAVLGNLPENQREALECAYFEGMLPTEIATMTGQAAGTVKTNIRCAMDALIKVLN